MIRANALPALFLVFVVATAQAAYAQTNNTMDDIRERGAFVIGADVPYGVMQFLDENGDLTGIDIEIANRISKDLNAELVVKMMPFDQLFGALANDQIDAVVSAVTITQERQKTMLFSVPYMDAGMSIAVSADNTEIKGINDLVDKRVGVLRGTVGETLMSQTEFVSSDLMFSYESNDKRIADLISGELDAIVAHFASDAVPNVRFVEPPLTQSFYGVAVRLDDTALMSSINATLRDMKRSGDIDRIKQTFLGSDAP
ncbi:MAG: ABC transporter substrate-binding protein [Pseudomonadota bacterium]